MYLFLPYGPIYGYNCGFTADGIQFLGDAFYYGSLAAILPDDFLIYLSDIRPR